MTSSMLVLDGSVSPYLPPREILEASHADVLENRGPAELARILRERLALLHGVAPARIALVPDDATRLDGLVRSRSARPLVSYIPTAFSEPQTCRSIEQMAIERTDRFRIEDEQIAATPRGSTVLVMTPNQPTGNAIGLTAAAQLARRSDLLILDERSAEMQRRSMIPLVEEFDSIVLMRSFADWAGLGPEAPAYAITARRIAAAMDRSDELPAAGLRAALAAVSNAPKLDAIAHRIRLERMRLFRMLRKLNYLAPFPSDAGYVLAEVTRGDRDTIAAGLMERGIIAHAPIDPRLRQTLRFSAISPVATARLQHALIDINRTMLG